MLLVVGTIFLFTVGDNAWSALSLIYILLIFAFWFLLRQSVRLVADAPEEALDERLIQIRDRSYVIAYRWLALLVIIWEPLFWSSPYSPTFCLRATASTTASR